MDFEEPHTGRGCDSRNSQSIEGMRCTSAMEMPELEADVTLSLVENIAWGESEVVDGARASASIRGKVCWNARQWGGSLGLWDTRAHGGSGPGCGDATSTPTIAVATPTPTGTWNSPTETATQVFTATPTFTRTLAEGEATVTPTRTATATVPPTKSAAKGT